ncbi:hypothetical protein PRO82_000931 [Candidatus Protochlamydia amoebophila]|nr:hypothetical protein [Candidatus Protochlamydia amoebophila]
MNFNTLLEHVKKVAKQIGRSNCWTTRGYNLPERNLLRMMANLTTQKNLISFFQIQVMNSTKRLTKNWKPCIRIKYRTHFSIKNV